MFFAIAGLNAANAEHGDEAWRQELLKEREQKDIEFKTSPTSPMAGSVRLTFSAPEKTYIAIARTATVAAQPRAGAGTVFSVFSRQGKWYWDDAAAGVTCRLEERAIAQDVDALAAGSLFKAGRFTLAVYPGPDSLALIVFDPQRPQLLAFKHLLYFPPDPAYAVKARLVKFPKNGRSRSSPRASWRRPSTAMPGSIFNWPGRDLELTALKSSLEGPDCRDPVHPFQGR